MIRTLSKSARRMGRENRPVLAESGGAETPNALSACANRRNSRLFQGHQKDSPAVAGLIGGGGSHEATYLRLAAQGPPARRIAGPASPVGGSQIQVDAGRDSRGSIRIPVRLDSLHRDLAGARLRIGEDVRRPKTYAGAAAVEGIV